MSHKCPLATLYHLVYVSKYNADIGYGVLREIFTVSEQNNAKKGITGFLCYGKGEFWQYIEGAKNEIIALLAKLKGDHRHSEVTVISEGDISTRQFTHWAMHCASFESVSRHLPICFRDSPLVWDMPRLHHSIELLKHYHSEHLKQSLISWQSKTSLTLHDFWTNHHKFLLLQAVLLCLFIVSFWAIIK